MDKKNVPVEKIDDEEDHVEKVTDDEDEIVKEDESVGSDYEEEEEEEFDTAFDQKSEEDLNNSDYYRKIKIVDPGERITSDIMSLYEYSEVIGIRTLQIEKGSFIFTDVSFLNDARDMAIKELFDRKCPLIVIRQISEFEQEHWKCNEMGFPADIRSGFKK